MPMAAAFLSDTFYAAKLFPLRNPFPGSYTTLDNLPWRHVMWQGSELRSKIQAYQVGICTGLYQLKDFWPFVESF